MGNVLVVEYLKTLGNQVDDGKLSDLINKRKRQLRSQETGKRKDLCTEEDDSNSELDCNTRNQDADRESDREKDKKINVYDIVCSPCNLKFSTKIELHSHMIDKHNLGEAIPDEIKCFLCFKFVAVRYWRTHVKLRRHKQFTQIWMDKNNIKEIPCPTCKETTTFSDIEAAITHLNFVHRMANIPIMEYLKTLGTQSENEQLGDRIEKRSRQQTMEDKPIAELACNSQQEKKIKVDIL